MAQRTPNYVLEEKLDKIIDAQLDTLVAIARVEERVSSHGETLDRHENCIDSLEKTNKWFGGINAILAVIAGVLGVNN